MTQSRTLAVFMLLLLAACSYAETIDSPYRPGPNLYPKFEGKNAVPGVTYGNVPSLELPKTILYSVTAEELLKDHQAWIDAGINAFFVSAVAPNWSSDIWASDKEPWTIGRSDKTFQTMKAACEKTKKLGCDVFPVVSFTQEFDWFDDIAWTQIENNFRQFAIFAKETGCDGLAIDVEYIGQQYHFSWEKYDFTQYSRRELIAKIRQRMTGVGRAMYQAFPDMVLLTFPEGGFSFGGLIQSAWIDVAAQRNAPGGVHLCTEFTYRRPNVNYMFGHAWMNNRLMQEFMSKKSIPYWERQCTIAEGLWPFGIDPDDGHGVAPTVEEYRQAIAASLMAGRRYNWIYSHDARRYMLGRDLEKYSDPETMKQFNEIVKTRAMITDEKYVSLAKELRSMKIRDYSKDLGVTWMSNVIGPHDNAELGLMPVSILEPSPLFGLRDKLWKLNSRLIKGEDVDVRAELQTQTSWMIVGPFANAAENPLDAVQPPETGLDFKAEYDGANGKVAWRKYEAEPHRSSINFARVLQPAEDVSGYAACIVESPSDQPVQFRFSANDLGKIWLDGKEIYRNDNSGRIMYDKDIIPAILKKGANPVLIKVSNAKRDWGFVFRITDANGKPVRNLKYNLE